MTKNSKPDLDDVRTLSKDEIDAVSGAALLKISLPGKVEVTLNKETGSWFVSLDGKTVYFDVRPGG